MIRKPYHHWVIIDKVTGLECRYFVTYLSAQQWLFKADPECEHFYIEPLL